MNISESDRPKKAADAPRYMQTKGPAVSAKRYVSKGQEKVLDIIK